MEQNNGNMMGNAHCAAGGTKKKTVVGNLLFFLVAIMGIANLGNNSLVKYYNNVAKATYNDVFVEKWNKFVGMAQKEDTTYVALAAEIKNNLMPAIDANLKLVNETTAPSFAEDYHNTFAKDLGEFKKKTQDLLDALNKGEEAVIVQKFKDIAPLSSNFETKVKAFRDRLATEKHIEFEKDPAAK